MAGSTPRTSVRIKGKTYGASADKLGPIGGGRGYRRAVASGDHRVGTIDELLAALGAAKAGEVIFLDGAAEFDFTERIAIEKTVLDIPPGVTLASDRGVRGSKGALVCSDTFATRPFLRTMGDGVRVTGIRLRGPDPKARLQHHRRCVEKAGPDDHGFNHKYYYEFPISDGVHTTHDKLEVDNCEVSAFSIAGVNIVRGAGQHIHHCFIHHCQYNGLGYGVCLDKGEAHIHHNLFNFNRHSIAATGAPASGYEAHDNVEIGASLSHCFDMHGGSERGDGTNIAGDWLKVHHNTFRSKMRALAIRGVPVKGAEVHRNWFSHADTGEPTIYTQGNTAIRDNACGVKKPVIVK
ncbi:MAG: hypothetical protein K8S99_12770 [Planctomycetes bacterium]|nr:hypothetical protein [Planctomycetota bacterium]